MINNSSATKRFAFIILMTATLTSQAQGLFDDIVSNVNTGEKRKKLTEEVFQKVATNSLARSVFTVEAGKPASNQATNTGDGKINLQVPVTVRIDENAYSAFYNDLRKHLEDPKGLNLKPVKFTVSSRNDGYGHMVEAHFFVEEAYKKLNKDILEEEYIFCIIERIILQKEAVIVAYSIDKAILEGIKNKSFLFDVDYISVDILDDKNEVIATKKINYKFSLIYGSYYKSEIIGPDLLNTRNGNSPPPHISKNYQITGNYEVNFNLPVEVLQKAKSFLSVINYKSAK